MLGNAEGGADSPARAIRGAGAARRAVTPATPLPSWRRIGVNRVQFLLESLADLDARCVRVGGGGGGVVCVWEGGGGGGAGGQRTGAMEGKLPGQLGKGSAVPVLSNASKAGRVPRAAP